MTDDTEKDATLFAHVALDDGSGPARRISGGAHEAMVASVLDGFFAVPTGTGGEGGGGSSGSAPTTPGAPTPATSGAMSKAASLSTTGKLYLIVSGAVLIAVGAGVFVATQPRPVDSPRVATSAPPAPAPLPVPAAPTDSPPVPMLEAPEASAPARESAPQSAAAPRVADRAPAVSVAPVEPVEPVDVAAMLERANAARRAGSYAEAARLYLAIVTAAPTSREAHVARVAAATIQLDRLNDPRAAARLFRSEARGGSGGLAAEAAFGLSRAARASGDRAAEVQALELLVRAHRSSPYAGVAERRLRELGVVEAETAPSP